MPKKTQFFSTRFVAFAYMIFFPFFALVLYCLNYSSIGWVYFLLSSFFFYFVPANILLFATAIFFVQTPVQALISLIIVLLHLICFLLSLKIEFFGLLLLLIYVGAVAVLFLFVVMLFHLKKFTVTSKKTSEPAALALFAFFFVLGFFFVQNLVSKVIKTFFCAAISSQTINHFKEKFPQDQIFAAYVLEFSDEDRFTVPRFFKTLYTFVHTIPISVFQHEADSVYNTLLVEANRDYLASLQRAGALSAPVISTLPP
jgi:NADH:ubiquinone oxidoreductase subunit 6 (subunit J)